MGRFYGNSEVTDIHVGSEPSVYSVYKGGELFWQSGNFVTSQEELFVTSDNEVFEVRED